MVTLLPKGTSTFLCIIFWLRGLALHRSAAASMLLLDVTWITCLNFSAIHGDLPQTPGQNRPVPGGRSDLRLPGAPLQLQPLLDHPSVHFRVQQLELRRQGQGTRDPCQHRQGFRHVQGGRREVRRHERAGKVKK